MTNISESVYIENSCTRTLSSGREALGQITVERYGYTDDITEIVKIEATTQSRAGLSTIIKALQETLAGLQEESE